MREMDYADFYDLAEYCNENWRGKFSHRETAINAYIYKVEYDAKGTESEVIKSLLEQLREDGSDEAVEWMGRITNESAESN